MDELRAKIAEYLAATEGTVDVYKVAKAFQTSAPEYRLSEIAEAVAARAIALDRPLLWEKW